MLQLVHKVAFLLVDVLDAFLACLYVIVQASLPLPQACCQFLTLGLGSTQSQEGTGELWCSQDCSSFKRMRSSWRLRLADISSFRDCVQTLTACTTHMLNSQFPSSTITVLPARLPRRRS